MSLKTLLIVAHAPSPNTKKLAQAAFDGAKPANRFHRIFRAGRHEAAAWAEQGADEAFVAAQQENKELIPILSRVNIQSDSAKSSQVVDNKWVAVGVSRNYAIQYDYTLPFQGKPSFRFELKNTDNTLEGYSENETKGRA